MTHPADHTALLDRLDGELADLGTRLSRVRADLGSLRASTPNTGAAPAGSTPGVPMAPAGPVREPAPPYPAGLGPWYPGGPASGPGAGGAPWGPRPASAPTAPWPAPARPVAPPRSAGPGFRLPRLTGARLLAVTGAGVTLLGVVLLLVLAASRGWFGPEARVVLGAVVGLGLVAAGVVLQSRRAGSPDDDAADPGPVSLAATGITALYLTVAAAASLYDFLPAPVALLLALLVAGGGLALADRWRRHGLALGVVVGAGVLLPLVVNTAGALLVALFVVLVVVTLPVAARRGWPSLVGAAVAGASLAGLVATTVVAAVSGGAGWPAVELAAAIGALVLVAGPAALLLVATAGTPGTRPSRAVVVAGIVLALPVLPLLSIAAVLPRPAGAIVDVVAVVVLLAVGALAERGPGRVPTSPVLATTAATAAAVVGLQAIPLALTGVAQGGVLLAVATVLAVVARGTRRTGVLLAAGAFGAIGFVLALGRDLPVDVVVDGQVGERGSLIAMAVVGLLVITTAAALLVALGRLGYLGSRERSAIATAVLGLLGLYGAAGLVVTVALAISPDRTGFLVGHVLVTISWTALALVLLVRGPRDEAVSLPRVLGGVLVVAAVVKLILFDLVALDGLARVAVFLGAGLVLLVAGTRYARWVTAGTEDAQDASATMSDEPGRLADHE
ncbi:DUF2339 domain-containing protein [Actinomycetospora endophytica]|uniref:DUF2339 domain-containing protein n=1 Tax=Actinomycetospora endophytica TaxID=2291215 RepID=A0ABS8P9J0_9PSEU|nr:DUF2339 domain-containing protein [Actinomycetospora endophytica]MCD2194952.1 DUF2339 domain-containing protein [Actinomycetospora endophytica]